MSVDADALRRLPKVGDVLDSELGRALLSEAPRWAVVDAVRAEIDRRRSDVKAGRPLVALDEASLRAEVSARLSASLRPVINATGVVLHTNLGRAPLAHAAIDRVVEIARGYSNLEVRLEEKARGSRHGHVTELLRALTGCEDAIVVNNCAAAVLLALTALARDRKVVVSRGELVEIGGGFRVPEVMAQSGATLVEVGTTNRTRAHDYEVDDAALWMKVHRSNFAIVGFTEEASVAELSARKKVPLFVDLGSGQLVEIAGLDANEQTVKDTIDAGADLVAFSGDKLLGGPQAGILVGRAAIITQIGKHPLMRALRPDKLTMAALEATLQLYRDERTAEVPTIAMLSIPEPQLEQRAHALVAALQKTRPDGVFVARRVRSAVGGGSLPTVEPWSWAVTAELPPCSETNLDHLLRCARPAVLGRIQDGALHLDVRTLQDGDAARVVDAFATLGISREGG